MPVIVCDKYEDPSNICESIGFQDPNFVCGGCVEGIDEDFFEKWQSSEGGLSCPEILSRTIYSGKDMSFSPEGFKEVTMLMNNLLTKYFNEFELAQPGEDGYNEFQDVLHDACTDPATIGGACNNYLCNKLCPQFSYTELGEKSKRADFCGCHVLPPGSPSDIFGDNISCYPLCHRIETVQLFDSTTGEPQLCPGTLCVIDDITINVAESDIGGDIDFTNICPSCPVIDNPSPDDERCKCIISGINITETMDSAGIGVNFDQSCGEGSTCYQEDKDGNMVAVNCDDFVPTTGPSDPGTNLPYILLGIVIFVIIIAILVMLASRHREDAQQR